jgi:2-aminoadipate transaminase
VDLGWGHPHRSLVPTGAWADAVAATLHGPDAWRSMTYGYPSGPAPLIEWLAEHLSHADSGRSESAQFFITAGASHGLALALAVLTAPGDVVLVDAPTYHLAFSTISDSGCQIAPTPTDDDGPDVEAIADFVQVCRRQGRRVAALYLVPTFGNPTGRSLPDRRRRQLVGLAQRLDFTIVEDDTYRELVYDGPVPASLWSHSDGLGVVRLGSFSKTVAPGLRLGWINAAAGVVKRLERLGYVDSGGGVNHTNACVMAAFGTSGAYRQHLARIRPSYARQRDALVDTLRVRLPTVATPRPSGGWFVWIPLPAGCSARALLPTAEQHGVSYVDGSKFHADGMRGDDHIRLAFSLYAEQDLVTAANRLADAVEAAVG